MPKLPKDVEAVKRALSRARPHELSEIADKLMEDTPALVAMWRSLEKWNPASDDLWVWAFLRAAANASDLPPYQYLSAGRRRDLSTKIATLSTKLAHLLEENNLDAHLIHINGKMFNGFYLYEDFGESNQAQIDAAGDSKLKVSELIVSIAKRSSEKIADEPQAGKAGANVRAIRFARLIAARNKEWYWYGRPLNAVTAAATNAIFGTSYAESDIRKLLAR